MSRLTKFIRNTRVRLFRRGIARHHHLRRHLAEYVLKYNYEIGDFSAGWPEVRAHDGAKLKVGKYCSIAQGATFVLGGEHPIAAATTFLLGSVLDNGRKLRSGGLLATRGDIVVGSDVWISSNALILSGVTIGDGAVVGLGSVVVRDVSPYSIVLGNPAQVVGKRFPDDTIAELPEVRWWDLEPQQVASLRPLLEGTDLRAFLAACRQCRGWPAEPEGKLRPKPTTAVAASPRAGLGGLEAQITAIISGEFPSFSAKDLHTPLDRLGIDSIAMLMIRTRIEEASGRFLDNRVWESAVTALDIVKGIYTAELADRQTG